MNKIYGIKHINSARNNILHKVISSDEFFTLVFFHQRFFNTHNPDVALLFKDEPRQTSKLRRDID